MTKEQGKTLSAVERLQGLEAAAMTMDRALGDIMRQMSNLSQAMKLLSEKVDAIVQASESGRQISNSVLNDIMVEGNIKELKAKAEDLKESGVIAEASEVGANSFIVFREMNSELGTVVSPRTQITVRSMDEEWRNLFMGKKVGDLVTKEGSGYSIEINEIYDIVEMAAPKTEEAPAAEAPVSQ